MIKRKPSTVAPVTPVPLDHPSVPVARVGVSSAQQLLNTGALQSAIFNSANFSSIATDAKGVIQIFNVGA